MSFSPLALLALLLFVIAAPLSAQSQRDWVLELKSPQVFIENLGQYDALGKGFGDRPRYVIDHGFGWQVLVGEKGIHYLVQRMERERPTSEEHAEEGPRGTVHTSRVSMEFVGVHSQAHLEAQGQQPDYYTYAYPSSGEPQEAGFTAVDHAAAFERLYFTGLYPGIDAEVVGKGDRGVKYSFYLQPHADPQQIRLRWRGATPIMDSQGDLHLPAVLGELIDHHPQAWYADDPQVQIPVEFALQGNEVTFSLGSYDAQRGIVIDPWTINPALPAPFNRAFEVDNDGAGNVFAWGGGMGYNLKKYNSAGTLQWTHVSPWDTSNSWFGELLVLPAGDVFITSGSSAKIRRLTAAGGTTFTNNGPFFNLDEYWTLVLSCDQTRLISGGTRIIGLVSPQGHLFNLNMTNGNQMAGSPYNVSPVGMKEIRALCTGGNGNYYMLSNDNIIAVNQTFGIIYSLASGSSHPYNSPAYKAQSVQGQNVIDANTTHIFTQNGATLEKRDINTGAILTSVAIPSGSFSGGFFGTGATNGGLVLDDCNNLFVGTTNAILKYDANLSLLGSVATTGTIYDLTVAPGGVLLAGGNALLISNTSLSPCAPKTIVCTVLPVELSYLQGDCEDQRVRLRWASHKETEMQHYEVERTTDGVHWGKVGQIPAVGNSTEPQDYSFEELLPTNLRDGRCYYRLRMVDRNGEGQYSGIATVVACRAGDAEVRVSPSITDGEVRLEFYANEEGEGMLEIMGIQGQVAKSAKVKWEPGKNALSLHLEGLPTGTYQIRVRDHAGHTVVKDARVVKQ